MNDKEWFYKDNAFSSLETMERLHQPIVELATKTLAEQGGGVVDFGCGNGALLAKIFEQNQKIVTFGVDRNPEAIDHAKLILPDFTNNFEVGSMFDESLSLWKNQHKLAILMPGRLLEIEASKAERFKEILEQRFENILVYAYGDWLTEYGSLQALCKKVGMIIDDSGPDSTAGIILRFS